MPALMIDFFLARWPNFVAFTTQLQAVRFYHSANSLRRRPHSVPTTGASRGSKALPSRGKPPPISHATDTVLDHVPVHIIAHRIPRPLYLPSFVIVLALYHTRLARIAAACQAIEHHTILIKCRYLVPAQSTTIRGPPFWRPWRSFGRRPRYRTTGLHSVVTERVQVVGEKGMGAAAGFARSQKLLRRPLPHTQSCQHEHL